MSAEYVVVVEKSESGFGPYAPDLPGCVSVWVRECITSEASHK